MKDEKRRRAAKHAAQDYAPRPESGLFMYGAIGIVLAGLSIALFGRFYDIDFLAHPIEGIAFILLAFAGAIGLWFVRSSRHKQAHRAEYERMK